MTTEDPTVLDRKILQWCQEHGWTEPAKKGLIWWAFPPNSLTEAEVPISREIIDTCRMAAAATGDGSVLARVDDLIGIDWSEGGDYTAIHVEAFVLGGGRQSGRRSRQQKWFAEMKKLIKADQIRIPGPIQGQG